MFPLRLPIKIFCRLRAGGFSEKKTRLPSVSKKWLCRFFESAPFTCEPYSRPVKGVRKPCYARLPKPPGLCPFQASPRIIIGQSPKNQAKPVAGFGITVGGGAPPTPPRDFLTVCAGGSSEKKARLHPLQHAAKKPYFADLCPICGYDKMKEWEEGIG